LGKKYKAQKKGKNTKKMNKQRKKKQKKQKKQKRRSIWREKATVISTRLLDNIYIYMCVCVCVCVCVLGLVQVARVMGRPCGLIRFLYWLVFCLTRTSPAIASTGSQVDLISRSGFNNCGLYKVIFNLKTHTYKIL